MRIEKAVEVFVRAFALTRSLTHPYLAEWVDGAWAMRDGPGRRGDPRNEEWVGYGLAPTQLDRVVGRHARGRFVVAYVVQSHSQELEARREFKGLGYRLTAIEPLFVHALADLPAVSSPVSVLRVQDETLALRLGKELRRRPLGPDAFAEDAAWRQYVAEVDGALVGWVASLAACDAAWCANLYVKPDHRRQGIAKALMARMLADDQALGRSASVLLSSHTGAQLYPTLGYRQIGTLLLYALR